MSSKKDFKNPALQFLNVQEEQPAKDPEPREEQIRSRVLFEARSRRVQLLIQPSLYEWAKNAAAEAGQSFNDYVHMLLELERDSQGEEE